MRGNDVESPFPVALGSVWFLVSRKSAFLGCKGVRRAPTPHGEPPGAALSPEGEHLPGVQQQQAAGPEAQVDPLLGPGYRAAPEEVHRQEAQPLVLQRGTGPAGAKQPFSSQSVFELCVLVGFLQLSLESLN